MSSLFDLASKVAAGGALAEQDARQLAATTDLATVGMVAAEARRVHGGDRVTFVRVAEFACGETLPDAGFPTAAGEVRITGTPASIDEAIATVRACARSASVASQSIFVTNSFGRRRGAGSRWHSRHQPMLSGFSCETTGI